MSHLEAKQCLNHRSIQPRGDDDFKSTEWNIDGIVGVCARHRPQRRRSLPELFVACTAEKWSKTLQEHWCLQTADPIEFSLPFKQCQCNGDLDFVNRKDMHFLKLNALSLKSSLQKQQNLQADWLWLVGVAICGATNPLFRDCSHQG